MTERHRSNSHQQDRKQSATGRQGRPGEPRVPTAEERRDESRPEDTRATAPAPARESGKQGH